MNFLVIPLILLSCGLSAQFQELKIEKVGKDRKIGTTYRIYASLKNEGDQLLVVFGDKDHQLIISSDKPFYQDPDGAATAFECNTAHKKNASKKDSWITITSDNVNHPELQFMGMNCNEFESSGKEITSGKDGAWYVLPTSKLSICGPDRRILIAQLTTKGNITGILNLMGKTHQGETWIQHDIKIP